MGIQDIIEKVKRLRSLAAGNTNVNECANAAALADRLIQEYNLSQAELTAENKISQPIIEAQTFLYETGKIIQWKSSLALQLARHYDVYVYNSGDYSTGRKQTRYAMIGRESDIQILQYNYEYLAREIQEMSSLCCVQDKRGISVEKMSFCRGAVDGIMQKLTHEKKCVQSSASSSAMALLNNKHKEAAQYANQKHNLRRDSSSSHSQHDSSAYSRGKEVGGKMSVSSGLNAGSKTGLLK